MLCKVLKSFPYAHEGVNTQTLDEGAEVEIRDELVPGLTDAGYLAKAGKAKAVAVAADAAADAAKAADTTAQAAKGAGDAAGQAAAAPTADQKPAA